MSIGREHDRCLPVNLHYLAPLWKTNAIQRLHVGGGTACLLLYWCGRTHLSEWGGGNRGVNRTKKTPRTAQHKQQFNSRNVLFFLSFCLFVFIPTWAKYRTGHPSTKGCDKGELSATALNAGTNRFAWWALITPRYSGTLNQIGRAHV